MSFSDGFPKLRIKNGYTQEQIAEMLGVSRQAVSKWENGDSVPDMDKIAKLADAFDVSLDELLGREKVIKSEQTVVASQDIRLTVSSGIVRSILIALFVLVLGIGIGLGINHSLIKAAGEKAVVRENSGFRLNDLEITGFKYRPFDLEQDYILKKDSDGNIKKIKIERGMYVSFVPSFYEEGCIFTVYAKSDEKEANRQSVASFANGECSCMLGTQGGILYTIVVEAEYENEKKYFTLGERILGDGSGHN